MTSPTFVPYSSVISAITNTNPAIVTTTSVHGLLDGSYVTFFIPYNTMPFLNGQTYLATIIDNLNFSIPVDTTNANPFTLSATQSAQVIPSGETALTLQNAIHNQT